jgi:hypothetical protein
MANMQSFNDVLISSNLCLVSTYKYDVGNCLFAFISYLLKCSLTSLQIKKNSMQYSKQCLTLNTQKTQECCFKELNPSFLYDLHHREVSNKYQYIEKMPKVLQLVAYGGIL